MVKLSNKKDIKKSLSMVKIEVIHSSDRLVYPILRLKNYYTAIWIDSMQFPNPNLPFSNELQLGCLTVWTDPCMEAKYHTASLPPYWHAWQMSICSKTLTLEDAQGKAFRWLHPNHMRKSCPTGNVATCCTPFLLGYLQCGMNYPGCQWKKRNLYTMDI